MEVGNKSCKFNSHMEQVVLSDMQPSSPGISTKQSKGRLLWQQPVIMY
jgi:hypothetical protein